MASGFTTPEGKVYGTQALEKAAKAACEGVQQVDYAGKATGHKSTKAPSAKSGRTSYGK